MQYQHNAADITVESVWLYFLMRDRERQIEKETAEEGEEEEEERHHVHARVASLRVKV